MSDEITIGFMFDGGEGGKLNFSFKKTSTIKEMLEDFLKRTNSVVTLERNKIIFSFRNKVLNSKPYENQMIQNIFGRGNVTVKIIDKNKIIGGNNDLNLKK